MAPTNDELNVELDPEAVRIGATIRELRKAYGLKVTELAEEVGISRPYLSNVEAGRKQATRVLCAQIAGVLNVPLAAIVSSTYRDYAEAGEP